MNRSKFPFLLAFVLAVPSGGASELTEITITASRDRLSNATPNLLAITADDLERSRVLTVNEALRKVPGLLAREEEGLGLRPNIGIRGLNPTRSSKVLLLEDGLPLTFAPYGDNATYFHPALERFERIEVLKNSGQIAFGPQTIGGIINYISGKPPATPQGRLSMRGGNRDLRAIDVEFGDTFDATGTGWRLDATHKHSLGSRENIELEAADAGLRLEQQISETQTVSLRANAYRERSQVGYSGLTLDEYRAAPRQNAFADDFFDIDRRAAALIHGVRPTDGITLRTAVYHTRLQRDWWRQSSNSRQRPNDASDPACGGMRNLSTTCGNEGRLRAYRTTGIDSRLQLQGGVVAGVEWQAMLGARHHREWQQRLQVHGDSPRARTVGSSVNGGLREDNRRRVRANSGFAEVTLGYGATTLTPGLRYEDIHYERADLLLRSGGSTALQAVVPGVALTQRVTGTLNVFASVHRGFAPPRVEDVIAGSGAVVELDPEYSWNREFGLRWQPTLGPAGGQLRTEATMFEMDFANQIVAASLAGGAGASLTNGGRTLHRGLELLVDWQGAPLGADASLPELLGGMQPRLRLAATWLRDARFRGERYAAGSGDAGRNRVSISGNRLPYAAEHLATLSLGGEWPGGLAWQIDGHYVGSMYTDDLNTVPISADGQRGRVGGHAVWNLTLNYRANGQLEWFGGIKNAADRLYIADLSRGIVPGPPRQLQAGFEYRF
jgi:Fe(3+) dicitrate transport protein